MEIQELFDKYLAETLTAEEMTRFRQLLQDEEQVKLLDGQLENMFDFQIDQEYIFPETDRRIEQHVMSRVRRVRTVRRWSLAAAAVILLLIIAGIFFQRTPQKKEYALADIPAGTNGAILTLADGKKVQLDSAYSGTVALQGGAVVKVQHGELIYTGGSTEIIYNTVYTPRGRQFQLTLPDRTKVWLNAGSTLHYPLLFSGKERKVELDGEGYFDVAQNASMPFKVDVNKKAIIEVLGTGFNIKAYENEEAIAATLLDGRIRVSSLQTGAVKELVPGQQALVQGNIQVLSNANTDKVIAWKNNLFDFEDSNLEEVMRQIERWYDIDVVYTGQKPTVEFTGKISRGMSLKNLLLVLEVSGVKCRLEDRTLFVAP
jgi:transmembrane sensor